MTLIQRYPGYVPPTAVNRPSADVINRLENSRQTDMYSGFGEVIPVVYGEQIVSGPRLVDPFPGFGGYVFAIALGHGPMESILAIRANGGAWQTPNGTRGWNNDAAVSVPLGAGLTVRARYDGTQTTVDPRLASAIAGFNDTFAGVAYVVLQFTPQENSSTIPEPEFRVQGRRVLDPRTSLVAWTENPALHLHDFVTNTAWGLGRQIAGIEAAADAADSPYSGVPRSRTGVAIQDPMSEEDALDLLCAYAEVFWGYDGDDITVIADIPVSGAIPTIPADQIIYDTIQLTGEPGSQTPTQVAVIFTDRSDESGATTRPALASMPSDVLQGTASTRSDVRLPGVYRRVEAERRAYQRLYRLQYPGRVAWQMQGLGVIFDAGDVVRMPGLFGMVNAQVRITAPPEMIGPGRYQLAGEMYDESQYPSDGGGVAVPVGGIVPYTGTIPPGYATWARGGFLLGDDTGGQASEVTQGSELIALEPAGGHTGTTEALPRSASSAGEPTVNVATSGVSNEMRGVHAHSFSVPYSSLFGTAPTHRMTWAKKTGEAAALVNGVCFLSPVAVNAERITAVMSAVGRYLASGATRMSQPQQQGIGGQTTSNGAHHHGNSTFRPGSGLLAVTAFTEEGNHAHRVSMTTDVRLRAKRLALYQASDEALIQPGGIIGWEDGDPPPGWALCDGQNGTIDLRGYFIEIGRPDQAGTTSAEATEITLSNIATDAQGAHNHKRTFAFVNVVQFGSSGRHGMRLETHAHGAAARTITSAQPGRYTLRFIQLLEV